jgi:alanine dehydrogenase
VRIGVPRETKDGERRVGIVPAGVSALARAGHTIVVERDAGHGSGFSNDDYASAGATIVADAVDVWQSTLIVKVKEVQRAEIPLLRPATTIFGFAQINRDPTLLDALLESGVRVVAYETVRDEAGALPLLAPMSRIAGRLAPLVGGEALQTGRGGNGTLLTGVDGVEAARVVVIGAGSVGTEAARIAARLGCRVVVLSRGQRRLDALARTLAAEQLCVTTTQLGSASSQLDFEIAAADLVIGAVLEPGTLSPKLISRAALRGMRRGSAFVDVGIDQGGIAETSRMTTLSDPTYVDEGIVHYAAPNLPALVARTATFALAAATLPYVTALADAGIADALDRDAGLAAGTMVWDGAIAHGGLATDAGRRQVVAPWRRQSARIHESAVGRIAGKP